jgi:hypothetical protein
MEITMADATTEETAVVETSDDSANTEAAATEATTAEVKPEEAALGDAGKKALDAMKAERKAAREEAAAAKAERDALQAKLDGKEAEHAAAQAAKKIQDDALAKANDRIRKSEVKAAAKGVLADPADAYKFLDLDSFEVDDDGNVDEAAIAKALDDLVQDKPYLAAQGGRKFQGSADGGARKDAAKAAQLTESDLDRMSPEQIDTARKEGRLNDLLGIKT